MRADVAKTPEPVQRLRGLFDAARQRELDHSTTASLASAGHTTRPSVRMATIAGVDARGPVFFPDWRSGKGQQLSDDPRAALCFDWQVLHQRIALECVTVHLADAEAERYWDRQTHANHLAAWVADTPPADGEGDTIDARVRAVRCRFRDGPPSGAPCASSPICISSERRVRANCTHASASPAIPRASGIERPVPPTATAGPRLESAPEHPAQIDHALVVDSQGAGLERQLRIDLTLLPIDPALALERGQLLGGAGGERLVTRR